MNREGVTIKDREWPVYTSGSGWELASPLPRKNVKNLKSLFNFIVGILITHRTLLIKSDLIPHIIEREMKKSRDYMRIDKI